MLREDLTVEGLKIMQIQFFYPQQRSLLLASPAVASLSQATTPMDEAWARGEGDLDFTLYDSSAVSAAYGRDAGSSRREDRNPAVDYGFLSECPMPPRVAGESVAERIRVLRRWMEACHLQRSGERLGHLLRSYQSPIAAEYDSFLSHRRSPDGRVVRGVVAPASDGGSVVALVIPLLTAQYDDARRTLTEITMLYAKAMRCPWDVKPNSITGHAFDLHLTMRTATGRGSGYANHTSSSSAAHAHAKAQRQGKGPAGLAGAAGVKGTRVLSQRVSVTITDGCATAMNSPSTSAVASSQSYVPLLQSCIDYNALPKRHAAYHDGETRGLAAYLPELDAALYRALREPLHFLKLTVALASCFGDALEVSPAVHEMEGGDGTAMSGLLLVKTASYCVVDAATSASFMIGVHYNGGSRLPSVAIACTSYLSRTHESLLRMKVRYPEDAETALETNDDGMLAIAPLVTLINASAMETMSLLLTLCQ